MPSKQNNYTDPDLRQEVKEEVQAGDKGGKPGQWSARKAQLTASEYKARGGDYTTSKDEKAPQQKNLDKWTGEEWQTKEGSGHAKQDDGTEKRYLPKKAWEGMSEEEKEETEKKKVEGSKEGKQFVGNTEAAKRKRGEVSKEGDKKDTKGKGEAKGKAKGKGKPKEDAEKEGEEDEEEEEDQDEMDEEENDGVDEDQGEEGDENEEEEEEEEEEVADDNYEENGGEDEDDEDAGADEPNTKESEAADTPQSEQPDTKRRKKD